MRGPFGSPAGIRPKPSSCLIIPIMLRRDAPDCLTWPRGGTYGERGSRKRGRAMHRHLVDKWGRERHVHRHHDDRSERCGWAVVLLRAMIMTVETDRRVAMGFTGPPCRWPAYLFRCGALIVAALGAACARRHRCDQRLVFAPRAAGRVRPSHPA